MTGTVNVVTTVTVPDNGKFDAMYRANGWGPNVQPSLASVVAAGIPVTAGRPCFQAADWLWEPIVPSPVLDPNSAGMVSALAGQGALPVLETGPYTDAVITCPVGTKRYPVTVTNDSRSGGGWGWNILSTWSVPLPTPFPALPSGGDGHLCIIDLATNLVFDLWATVLSSSGVSCGWGGVYPLDGSGIGYQVNNGGMLWENAPGSKGTGSGLCTLAGMTRLAELASGSINHALCASTNITTPGGVFRFPATVSDGSNPNNASVTIPEGARLQLDPSVNLSSVPGITPVELTIGHALQTYGVYIVDTSTGASPLNIGCEMPQPGITPPWPGTPSYLGLPHLPLASLRVLRAWNGT